MTRKNPIPRELVAPADWTGSACDQTPCPFALSDVAAVRSILIEAACAGTTLTYSELLRRMGHSFARPRMRAICRTLAAVDEAALEDGEPELAVLVVRQSDGLPGRGWWSDAWTFAMDGEVHGRAPGLHEYASELQNRAFAYWSSCEVACRVPQ